MWKSTRTKSRPCAACRIWARAWQINFAPQLEIPRFRGFTKLSLESTRLPASIDYAGLRPSPRPRWAPDSTRRENSVFFAATAYRRAVTLLVHSHVDVTRGNCSLGLRRVKVFHERSCLDRSGGRLLLLPGFLRPGQPRPGARLPGPRFTVFCACWPRSTGSIASSGISFALTSDRRYRKRGPPS